MNEYDKIDLVDATSLALYLEKPLLFIEENTEHIIGSIKIGEVWRYNLNLIKWLLSKGKSYISTESRFAPNHIKSHEIYKIEYVSVPFYCKRHSFHFAINNIKTALCHTNLMSMNKSYITWILDSLFRSSQDERQSFDYDNFMVIIPFLLFEIEILYAGPRPDYFRAEINGGYKHRNMAKIVLRHCKYHNDYEPEVEAYHNDKRVDIYDIGKGIIYEIGDTDPIAIYRHFFDKTIKSIYVIPFQPHDDNYVYSIKIQPKSPLYAIENNISQSDIIFSQV